MAQVTERIEYCTFFFSAKMLFCQGEKGHQENIQGR